MPNNDTPDGDSAGRAAAAVPLSTTTNAPTQPKASIFSLPPPVKRVFDQFPLREYEANDLPWRAPRARNTHKLHVFATDHEATDGRPSFNPSCLKWQTYLRLSGIDFTLVASNNHASPSGSLPFLQPASSTNNNNDAPDPIPANKLKKWVSMRRSRTDTNDLRADAYQSLIDNRIRKCWLYQLYLAPQNDALMQRLYVQPCSKNSLVRFAITRPLRAAAEKELVKSSGTNVVDAAVLIKEVEEAFEALSVLLGMDEWFFGKTRAGLFDASLFAYTHLVLDGELGWEFSPLEEALRRHGNLVRHRDRILTNYYCGDHSAEHQAGRPEMHVRTTSMLGKRRTPNSLPVTSP